MGLGNPGIEYRHSPHNLGFMVIDQLAAASGAGRGRKQGQAWVAPGQLGGRQVLLVKPQTFMNRSGLAVQAVLDRHRLAPADLIVICDDLALPFGKVRVRAQGSSGGHKGLQSIIESIGSSEFIRVRLGIGAEAGVNDVVAYVLAAMPREKQAAAQEMIGVAGEAVRTICQSGVQAAMNQHN